LAYVVSLPIAADVNFTFRERLARALLRARTYLRFRRNPELQRDLLAEMSTIRDAARALDAELSTVSGGGRRRDPSATRPGAGPSGDPSTA
jgi:hypothetical protein